MQPDATTRDVGFTLLFHALLRLHFLSFIGKCIDTIDPAANYRENWHIRVLALKLELVRTGKCRRLMINLPPRSLKTHIVSVAFTAWLLGHDPTMRIICVTYSNDVSKNQAQLFAKIVRSEWFKAAFPDCQTARRLFAVGHALGGGEPAVGGPDTGHG